MIVADCNLIAYLLLEGPRTRTAEAVFLRDPAWAAPLLWRSELRNVLATQMRVNHFPLAEALLKMTEAETVIGSLQFPVSSDEVLEECVRSGVSAYDAEYLVVARKLQIPLLTHDQRLLSAGTRVARTPEAFLAR